MKFKDINKIGFYACPKDTNREVIFEVFENNDADWLKKEPEAKLLVDTWYYSHTDTDDIKHYDVGGTLITLCRENPENKIEVEEITDTKYIVKNIVMQEDKLTYKQKYNKTQTLLDEIEETAKDFHLSMIIFHRGTTHEMADRIDYYLDKIKQLIKQAKEGEYGLYIRNN